MKISRELPSPSTGEGPGMEVNAPRSVEASGRRLPSPFLQGHRLHLHPNPSPVEGEGLWRAE